MRDFLLVLRDDPSQMTEMPSPDQFAAIIEKYKAWSEGLAAKGLLVGGNKLTDGHGRVMKPEAGGVKVKDGPYAETKEIIGGYYLIKAESYDHAVELCEGHPNFMFGSIEIRELDAAPGA
jgi:hypothetical protein